MTLIYS